MTSVAFSPDGRTLASGAKNGTLFLWDAASGKQLHSLAGHADAIASLAFSPDRDGRILASGSEDKTIRLWDLKTQKPLITLEGLTGPVSSLVFDDGGRALISGLRNRTLRRWDLSGLIELSHRGLSHWIERAQTMGWRLQGLDLDFVPPSDELPPPLWSERHPNHWLKAAEQGDRAAIEQLIAICDRAGDADCAAHWRVRAQSAAEGALP